MIDVVIISDAKTLELHNLTIQAINTAKYNAGVPANIIVVESQPIEYDVKTIHPDIPFNYNAYLNLGAREGINPYIAFCNNDLIFFADWAKNLIEGMTRASAESASPFDECHEIEYRIKKNSKPRVGYWIRKHFAGWCFVWTRSLFEKINHDEDFGFWCADNSSAELLKKKGVRHVLIPKSHVRHLMSATLYTLPQSEQDIITWGGVDKFNNKYSQNLFDRRNKK